MEPGVISTRVSFTGICLFCDAPALRIPPLPKSRAGMGVPGPFSVCVSLQPDPTPGASPHSCQPRKCENPLEQSSDPRGLAWKRIWNGRVLPGRSHALSERQNGGLPADLRSRAGRRWKK